MSLIHWRNKQHDGIPGESAPLANLRNEMDRLFDSFIREPFGMLDWPAFMGGEKWWPAVDVAESDKEVIVRAEIPGIDPKELDVTVTGNQLVISGEKKESNREKRQRLLSQRGPIRIVPPRDPAARGRRFRARRRQLCQRHFDANHPKDPSRRGEKDRNQNERVMPMHLGRWTMT